MYSLQRSDPSSTFLSNGLRPWFALACGKTWRNLQQRRNLLDLALRAFTGIALTVEHRTRKVSRSMGQQQPLHRRLSFRRFQRLQALPRQKGLAQISRSNAPP